jgi:hypothetical protein
MTEFRKGMTRCKGVTPENARHKNKKARNDAGLEVFYCFYVQSVARREIIPTQLSIDQKRPENTKPIRH